MKYNVPRIGRQVFRHTEEIEELRKRSNALVKVYDELVTRYNDQQDQITVLTRALAATQPKPPQPPPPPPATEMEIIAEMELSGDPWDVCRHRLMEARTHG